MSTTREPHPFERILVANRGEIACRVLRTARALGYGTVAIYSEADAGAPHVALADEAVCVGPPPVGRSYLASDAILAAARATGADAVHPGYGFLSENAAFARACDEAGLCFIGPPAAAIELMGNKRAAKIAMRDSGVPCVPGEEVADQRDEALAAAAARVGFPLMVKAAAGGGGRGMRLVPGPAELGEALRTARSEAASAFGSGELILERAVVAARHVEVQVFADRLGSVVHLGERDCSVQRRHQKVIEECPSPAVDDALRARMGAAAVRAAAACGYVGAGTVEFLLDPSGAFYFLEMNTRLQVEHPVTELVTGLDLVEWQLRVAAGEPLPLTQEEVRLTGHAIEVRLYAEDPARSFLPQTGVAHLVRWPEGAGVRVDHALGRGLTVSPHYDPMLAKLIAGGRDREDARRRLAAAVDATVVLGVTTNQAFLGALLRHPAFVRGDVTTGFLEREMAEAEHVADGGAPDTPPAHRLLPDRSRLPLPLAAALFWLREARSPADSFEGLGWRSGSRVASALELVVDEERHALTVEAVGRGLEGERLEIGGAANALLELVADQREAPAGEGGPVGRVVYREVATGRRRRAWYAFDGDRLWLDVGGGAVVVEDRTRAPRASDRAGSGVLVAPLDGAVVSVRVQPGEHVTRGQVVVTLEAMKMEHPVVADVDGVVRTVLVATGDQVRTRQLVAEVEPEAPVDAGGAGR